MEATLRTVLQQSGGSACVAGGNIAAVLTRGCANALPRANDCGYAVLGRMRREPR